MTSTLKPWLPPEVRYREDANFHHVVDMLESMIHQAGLTPSEVRDASMLAAIHYELRNVRHMSRRDGTPLTSETREDVHTAYDRIDAVKRWMDENPIDDMERR
jgi:argininosuccinate lyase